VVRLSSHGLWSAILATVLLEEDSGPTSAKTNLENILHKGESATHEMDAILKKKQKNKWRSGGLVDSTFAYDWVTRGYHFAFLLSSNVDRDNEGGPPI